MAMVLNSSFLQTSTIIVRSESQAAGHERQVLAETYPLLHGGGRYEWIKKLRQAPVEEGE